MARLARAAGELDATLRAEQLAASARVVGILDKLDEAASELDGGGGATNHPLLGANLALFRSDLRAARAAAAADPPSYYLAGAMVGSCRYCHQ